MSKDLEVSFDPRTAQLPTLSINRTTVFAYGQMVRFTFGEGFPGAGEPIYAWRCACAMTLDDAQEVAEITLKIIEEQRRRIEALNGQGAGAEGLATPQGSA